MAKLPGDDKVTPAVLGGAAIRSAVLASLLLLLSACGTGGSIPTSTGALDSATIAWGPRLGITHLSAVAGAEDDFGTELGEALARAARSIPNGGSQSSLTENGRTAQEMSVRVIRDEDGNQVYEVTDGSGLAERVPGPSREGSSLALFTDLLPGIEPDLSSYPHELLGVWALGGEAGAFWNMSPSIPTVAFGELSPVGTATYEGYAVGLHAVGDTTAKFLADVEMVADFESHTVSGEVDAFRSLAGESLGALSVTLGETGFSPRGDPFSGSTTAGVAGGGKWGARWSDGEGWTMGGTFGFAADHGSLAILGAFDACSCPSGADGNPDDPVVGTP